MLAGVTVLAKPVMPEDLWLYGSFILFAKILSSVYFLSFKGTKNGLMILCLLFLDYQSIERHSIKLICINEKTRRFYKLFFSGLFCLVFFRSRPNKVN